MLDVEHYKALFFPPSTEIIPTSPCSKQDMDVTMIFDAFSKKLYFQKTHLQEDFKA